MAQPGQLPATSGDGEHQGDKRLVIREMVLENFKSYAGEQRVGPFHKSFSAVVGPNGSGKSNVIDAMLFVFGRRAKQLRFNKVSELIHNSANHKDLEYAKVSVHFQDIIDREGEGYDVVPNSGFVVARTALRSNESHYYINGRKVSVKDVVELLKSKGIDLDNNRFLILQGEVEQISMMKPKAEDKNDTGLLEYLEDIIGTDQYVTPIEEASKKLEELNDSRQGMTARLKVAEQDKEALAGKAAEAQAFLTKQAEMYRNKAGANHSLYMAAAANQAHVEQQSAELQEKLAKEKNKLATHDKDVAAAEKCFTAADKAHQKVVKEIEAASQAFKALENRDAQVAEDMKAASQRKKKAEAKLVTDTAALGKLESEAQELEAAGPAAVQQAEALAAALAEAETVLEGLMEGCRGEVEGHRQALSQVRAELAPWDKQLADVAARRGVAQAEVDVLTRRGEEAKKRLGKAVEGLKAARTAASERSKESKRLAEELRAAKTALERQRGELGAAQGAEQSAEAAVKGLHERAAALRQDLSSSQHQGGIMKALNAAMAKGEVSGVHGRLGDLAAIDAKYDTAISTAAGALDYIVVDTASDAQRCVEALRRASAGVATFLILEKQRHLAGAAAEKLATPEGALRLFDLIKLSPKAEAAGLRTAFYYALGNTLVANDLAQASRIAYGSDRRFRRVVTLQGQLIADTGTMSGGGRPVSGKMALGSAAPRGSGVDVKAAESELREVERQLEAASGELSAARTRLVAAERTLRDAEKEIASLEVALPKAQMDAAAQQQRATDIEARLGQLGQETQVSEDDAARIQELQGHVASEQAQYDSIKAQMAGLEAKAAAIQAKIDNAGGEKLKRAKATVASSRAKLEKHEAETSRRAVAAKTTAKAIDKARKDLAKLAKDREKAEADLAALRAEVDVITEQGGQAQARLAEAQQRTEGEEGTAARLEAARAERDSLKLSHSIITNTISDIEEALQGLAKTAKEEGSKATGFKKEEAAVAAKLAEVESDGAPAVDESAFVSAEGQPPITVPQLLKMADDLHYKAAILEAELGRMSPDLDSITEHKAKLADWQTKKDALDACTAERDKVRAEYERLRKARLDGFMAGFNTISSRLKEMYQMITCGGDAELELVDSLDPFSEGIIFSVRPPRKSWKSISNLSGGEKTLASLSLVFALHHYKPNPLYVMDEIDAALDYKNVSIVGHYIQERTKNAQFVIISLRNNMFELAKRLVGIYKTDYATKTVAINPEEFVVPEIAAPAAVAVIYDGNTNSNNDGGGNRMEGEVGDAMIGNVGAAGPIAVA